MDLPRFQFTFRRFFCSVSTLSKDNLKLKKNLFFTIPNFLIGLDL